MKSLLVLASLVAFAYGQEEGICRCALFVTVEEGEAEVWDFPDIPIDDCQDDRACARACLAEWEELSNGGDLCSEAPGGQNLAENICETLADLGHENVGPHPVYIYYEVCDGPWVYDGDQSEQALECRNGESVNLDC